MSKPKCSRGKGFCKVHQDGCEKHQYLCGDGKCTCKPCPPKRRKVQGLKVPRGLKQAQANLKPVSKVDAVVSEANRRITEIQQHRRHSAPLVSRNPDDNWYNDAIQFPRLIAELQAVGALTSEVMRDLRETMDLEDVDILTLLDRADRRWEAIKKQL